jgi:hypothetical protein
VIPLGELGLELILAVGAALFAANLWVLLRPRFTPPDRRDRIPKVPSMRRVYINLAVGGVATIWAAATLVTRR